MHLSIKKSTLQKTLSLMGLLYFYLFIMLPAWYLWLERQIGILLHCHLEEGVVIVSMVCQQHTGIYHLFEEFSLFTSFFGAIAYIYTFIFLCNPLSLFFIALIIYFIYQKNIARTKNKKS